MVVAWHKGAKGYEFGRVRTTQDLTNQLRQITVAAEHSLKTRDSKAYAIGDDLEDDEYMVAPLAQLSIAIDRRKSSAIDYLESNEQTRRPRAAPTTADPIAFRKAIVAFGGMSQVGAHFLRNKRTAFYAILRGSSQATRTAYIRDVNPMKLVKPGNMLLSLGDTLSTLETTVFLMDTKIDIVIRPNQIDVLNKGFFDRLFFDLSATAGDLDRIVRESLEVLPLAPNTLTALVERSRLRARNRRKLLEIHQSQHLRHITIKQIGKALLEQGYDPARFISKQGGKELLTAGEGDIDTLLAFLNEDLFHGGLTGRHLAASKKRVISGA